MQLFKKKDKDVFEESYDNLVVFNHTTKTSDIVPVSYVDAESVVATGLYKIPLADCEATNSREGRNFFYRAPQQSVEETARLAQLEKSMVLQQITSYKPPVDTTGPDFGKLSMLIIVVMLIIVLGLSSCSG